MNGMIGVRRSPAAKWLAASVYGADLVLFFLKAKEFVCTLAIYHG